MRETDIIGYCKGFLCHSIVHLIRSSKFLLNPSLCFEASIFEETRNSY
jgi:hypothetical protein